MDSKDTIIVIGSGGRENAIVNALIKNQTNRKLKILCFGPNINPGIVYYSRMEIIKLDKQEQIIKKINDYKNSGEMNFLFAIIGPEQPIADGMADKLIEIDIPCIAPTKSYAKIESDKLFCRTLLEEVEEMMHRSLSPAYKSISCNKDVSDFSLLHSGEVVIKKTGLSGGKGVYVSGDHFNGIVECKNICEKLLDDSCEFIMEEKLIGNEYSLMTFCDGNGNFRHMPPIRDFKRAYPNDLGPNTGGMGCLIMEGNTLPYLNVDDIIASQQINECVAEQLKVHVKEKLGYRGILYGSFMKTTSNEIKVIEYNCRFGDPEALIALRLLKNDFFELCKEIVEGKLTSPVNFLKDACVCKYLVPDGYPNSPLKDYDIYLNNELNKHNIFYGSVSQEDGHLYQLGSRAIACVINDDNIHSAALQVNRELRKIYGRLWFRDDIGINEKGHAYTNAGVDIDKGNSIVQRIKPYLISTYNENVGGLYGDFNGSFRLPQLIGHETMLVASTDGVGTKSIFIEKHLKEAGFYNLGQDLVNHCINDILVSGAYPLFFLDYFASSAIKSNEVIQFVKGISFACRKSGCVLLGGETAEMPDVYKDDRTDLVGTIVGRQTFSGAISGKQNICENDIVIGLPSNGLHTNGYSLIRKIKESNIPEEYMKYLTQIHRSYLEEIKLLQMNSVNINGLCHITGGGLIDNPPRVIPEHLKMTLKKISWYDSSVKQFYDWVKSETGISQDELYKVFNCGLGMLIIVNPHFYDKICKTLKVPFYLVGKIEKRHNINSPQVVIS